MPQRAKATPAHAGARKGSILTPTLDFLFVGGLSLIFFVPLLLSGRSDLVIVSAGAQAWLGTAINMPHFMASYRLVYRDRASIAKHKWAAVYVPIILAAAVVAAIWEAQTSSVLIIVLATVASVYLAWHYTAQTWGMMASYAYLGGLKWETNERRLVQGSLRLLLAWHVAWYFYRTAQLRRPEMMRPIYELAIAGSMIAVVIGSIAFVMVKRRTGQWPPFKAIVAWMAIFAWYAMVWRDPKAIFWLQIAHALQYLAFPIRVELNTSGHTGEVAISSARHMVIYAIALLGLSVLITQIIPYTAMSAIGNLYGEEPGKAAPILILLFINIHHYFTDGVIWKLRNPEVRKELFAHMSAQSR